MRSRSLTLACEPFPAPRQGMAFHIGSAGGVSVVASSARGVVDPSLLSVANGARLAIDHRQSLGGNRRCAGSIFRSLTMIETFQPSIGLVFCVFSHLATLPMRVGSIHGQADACRSIWEVEPQCEDIRIESKLDCEKSRIRYRRVESRLGVVCARSRKVAKIARRRIRP